MQCKIEIAMYKPTHIKYTLNNWVNWIRQSKGTLIFNVFENWSTYHCYVFVCKLQYLLSFHSVFSPETLNSLNQNEAGESNTKMNFYFLLKNWFLWRTFFIRELRVCQSCFKTHLFLEVLFPGILNYYRLIGLI